MIKPSKLKIGDTIGVIAPSNSILEKDEEEVKKSVDLMRKAGFNVKFAKNVRENSLGYSALVQEKIADINEMFSDNEVKAIFMVKGGENSNSLFDYLDYNLIKNNPKILCGFSDSTSLTNMITQRTGLVTFNGPTFKSLTSWETDYGFRQVIKRFVDGSLDLAESSDEFVTIKAGSSEGELIGGNLTLTASMATGKYKLDFTNKILFLEELGFETGPCGCSRALYFMKQNGVFDSIKGLWIGNYEHESNISLEKIVLDVLDGSQYDFPIIKSNNFGHIDKKMVIPIGTKAKIETLKDIKIELTESCCI